MFADIAAKESAPQFIQSRPPRAANARKDSSWPLKRLNFCSPSRPSARRFAPSRYSEPRASDYLELGEPRIFARTPDGSFYAIEDIGVVKQYLTRCIHKKDSKGLDMPNLGAFMALSDIRRAREAVLGFFSDVAPATEQP